MNLNKKRLQTLTDSSVVDCTACDTRTSLFLWVFVVRVGVLREGQGLRPVVHRISVCPISDGQKNCCAWFKNIVLKLTPTLICIFF